MKLAISLAKKNIGICFPNPSVGCVIVKDGIIISTGTTSPGGRPHAEVNAINNALNNNIDITGADFYVTLEPCSHVGKTGPCCVEMAKYKPKNCYVGTVDIGDERVNGAGIKFLKENGVNVQTGIMSNETDLLVSGFFKQKKYNKPLVTLKIASTFDGMVALKNFESKWITNDISRKYGHYLRSINDAILCGSSTYKIDNPKLDCRIKGLEHKSPDIFVYSNKNIENINVISGEISDTLEKLGDMGYTNVLVEGGPNLISEFLKSGEYDFIYHFIAPKFIGADGVNCVSMLGLNGMEELDCLKIINTKKLGDDILNIYTRGS